MISHSLPMHHVSSNTVSIGDVVTYTIELPVTMIESLEPTFNGLEIIESGIDRRVTSNAHQFKLQVFSVDELMIPTLSLTEINGFEPLALPPIYFNLVSLLSPTKNQLNDIEPILGLFYINWVVVAIALTIVMICAIAFYTWRKKKQTKMIAHRIKQDPPIVIAMNEINKLKKHLSNDPDRIKQGYFKLTEIFCTYLTQTTTLNVLDATTVEMHRLLKKSKTISPDMIQSIINVAKEMDHYKFSKAPELNISNIESIIGKIVALIKGVKP